SSEIARSCSPSSGMNWSLLRPLPPKWKRPIRLGLPRRKPTKSTSPTRRRPGDRRAGPGRQSHSCVWDPNRRPGRGPRAGTEREVWAWLEHRKEPEVRSYLVTSLASYGTDPSVLAGELERQGKGEAAFAEKNAYLFDASVSRRRALLNALAGYPKDRLEPEIS